MTDLEDLAARIKSMSHADQLRLAAELLERRKFKTAQAIISRVDNELGTLFALGKLVDG